MTKILELQGMEPAPTQNAAESWASAFSIVCVEKA